MILYMYIAPGQGQTTQWGPNFDVNRNSLSLCPFVASIKTFLPFFMCFFHMFIAPGRGRQPIVKMTPSNQFQTFPTKHVITSVLHGVKIAFLEFDKSHFELSSTETL